MGEGVRFFNIARLPVVAIATSALAMSAGCSDSPPKVDWSKYSPSVHKRIDSARDCEKLQEEFNIASGHHSVDLMKYVDHRMRSLGCYK